MPVEVCVRCEKAISEQSVDLGEAVRHEGRTYCNGCAAKMRLIDAMQCPLCSARDLPMFDGRFYICRRCGENITSKEDADQRQKVESQIAAQATARACPRCSQPLPQGAKGCPRCDSALALRAGGGRALAWILGAALAAGAWVAWDRIRSQGESGEPGELTAETRGRLDRIEEDVSGLESAIERIESMREQLAGLSAQVQGAREAALQDRERVGQADLEAVRRLEGIELRLAAVQGEVRHLEDTLGARVREDLRRLVEEEIQARNLLSQEDVENRDEQRRQQDRLALEAQTVYWRVKTAADQLRSSGELARALAEVERYPFARFRDTEWGIRMESDREEILHEVAQRWAALRGESEVHLRNGDAAGAVSRLEEALRVCGTAELRGEIDARLSEAQRATPGSATPGHTAPTVENEADQITAWIEALGDREASVRARALRSLVGAGPEAEAPLISALGSDSSQVRGQVAEALGRRRALAAVGPLGLALERETDSLAAHRVCAALGQIGDRESLPVLLSTLEHEDHSRATSALEAIESITHESIRDGIGEFPEDLRDRMEYAATLRQRLGMTDPPR